MKDKFKIISDGTDKGTQIIDEDGRDLVKLYPVTKVSWEMDADRRIGKAVIEIATYKVEADLVGVGEVPGKDI